MSTCFCCPLCQNPLEVLMSKKEKPYVKCDECGMQMFVRYRKGIERLKDIVKRDVSFLDDYVLCRKCSVAVKKSLKKIRRPLLGVAGLYCPECGGLLLKAPEN